MTEPSHYIARISVIGQAQVADLLGYARMSTVEVAEPPLQLLQTVPRLGTPLEIPVMRATSEASRARGTHSGRMRLAVKSGADQNKGRAGWRAGAERTAANAQRAPACRRMWAPAFPPASPTGHGVRHISPHPHRRSDVRKLSPLCQGTRLPPLGLLGSMGRLDKARRVHWECGLCRTGRRSCPGAKGSWAMMGTGGGAQ